MARLAIEDVISGVEREIQDQGRIMFDAWVLYGGEKWFPYIIKEKNTGKRGFEINPSGRWGRNEVVGREKISLLELLSGIASRKFSQGAVIRCKPLSRGAGSGDARYLKDLQFSPKLRALIDGLRLKADELSDEGSESRLDRSSLALTPKHLAQKMSNDRTLVELEEALASVEQDTANLTTSEREAVVKARIGQGAFRKALIDLSGDVCWMSGVQGKELLVASHIQPWALCQKNPKDRGALDNGLLLSALWDAAFDAGLVTFDGAWRAIPADALSATARKQLGLDKEMCLPDRFRTLRRAQFLAFHRTVVFKGSSNDRCD
ncbi:MAG: HNH endonuclease [Comamonadaceae bacterium]|nr:HNH endonuclease [Comamonadaceae bacterium]